MSDNPKKNRNSNNTPYTSAESSPNVTFLQNDNDNDKMYELDLNSDENLNNIILNLKIISKLKPGVKLSIKEDNSLYIDNSYLQYIYRIFSDNSRDLTTDFLDNLNKNINIKIENIINQQQAVLFLNTKETILLDISHNLTLALTGLNNLINTYGDDECTVSKIEIIIKSFESKIRKISETFKVS